MAIALPPAECAQSFCCLLVETRPAEIGPLRPVGLLGLQTGPNSPTKRFWTHKGLGPMQLVLNSWLLTVEAKALSLLFLAVLQEDANWTESTYCKWGHLSEHIKSAFNFLFIRIHELNSTSPSLHQEKERRTQSRSRRQGRWGREQGRRSLKSSVWVRRSRPQTSRRRQQKKTCQHVVWKLLS